MARSVLSAEHFQDEVAAFAYVEAKLWPNGPVCPFCGETARIGRLNGKTTRPGLCKCYVCQKPFTVRMGTILESSHLALRYWLQAIHLMCASKKGISTRQIQRMLNCSMKTAWHLTHRIRAAMAPGSVEPLGGEGKIVEADETFLANSPKTRKTGPKHSRPTRRVMSLVERHGSIRSMFMPIGPENWMGIRGKIAKHVHPASKLVTDGAQHYKFPPVAKHESVDHSKFEWARGDVHINTLEGYFSIFKRGLIGIYQHVDERHLQRYVDEFDFRMNHREKLGVNDTMRAEIALKGVKGKRLTYRTTGQEVAE